MLKSTVWFASCEIGNKITEEQQWAKLALVKRNCPGSMGKNSNIRVTLGVKILSNMAADQRAAIISNMSVANASQVTILMEK